MIRCDKKYSDCSWEVLPGGAVCKGDSRIGQKKSKGPSVAFYLDTFGEVGTILWFADFEDFAAWEKVANQLFASQEYPQKVNQAADLFIQGSASDTIMRAI